MVSFAVGREDLGTTEEQWCRSPRLARLPGLEPRARPHVVVVAPHPDDEVLGAGGLLQGLLASGATLDVVWVTDGEASAPMGDAGARIRLGDARISESRRALERLRSSGYRSHRLRVPDGAVARSGAAVEDRVADLLVPGSLCLAPWSGDGHPDHDAVGQAAERAVRHRRAELLGYLVWAWHWTTPDRADLPWDRCRRLDLDRRTQARKRWAISAFSTQVRPRPAAPDGTGVAADPVLPGPVLRRFWRPFEVFVT